MVFYPKFDKFELEQVELTFNFADGGEDDSPIENDRIK
jgi:hypothetical protein